MKLRIEESFFGTFLESRLREEKAVFGTAILGTTSARTNTVKNFWIFRSFGMQVDRVFKYWRQMNFKFLRDKTVNRMQLMLTLYCTYRCMCLLLKRVNKTESTLKHTWPYYCLQPKLLVDELSQAQLSSPCLGSSIRHPSFKKCPKLGKRLTLKDLGHL